MRDNITAARHSAVRCYKTEDFWSKLSLSLTPKQKRSAELDSTINKYTHKHYKITVIPIDCSREW